MPADGLIAGLVDLHVHFMPDSVLRKVWAYFDRAGEAFGRDWPIEYRVPEAVRIDLLRAQGVVAFAPLVYAHRPGMARWLTEWVGEFADRTPRRRPNRDDLSGARRPRLPDQALEDGARCVKVHVQVGGFDPRDDLLDGAWGLLAEAGTAVVVHCADGPQPGARVHRAERLRPSARPTSTADRSAGSLGVARLPGRSSWSNVSRGSSWTPDWAARLSGVADRIAFGSDFPNIPYRYDEQVRAIEAWAAGDDRLGAPFLLAVLHDTPARLLALDG